MCDVAPSSSSLTSARTVRAYANKTSGLIICTASISSEIIQVDGLVKQVLNCIIDNDKEISINSLMTITFLMNGTSQFLVLIVIVIIIFVVQRTRRVVCFETAVSRLCFELCVPPTWTWLTSLAAALER